MRKMKIALLLMATMANADTPSTNRVPDLAPDSAKVVVTTVKDTNTLVEKKGAPDIHILELSSSDIEKINIKDINIDDLFKGMDLVDDSEYVGKTAEELDKIEEELLKESAQIDAKIAQSLIELKKIKELEKKAQEEYDKVHEEKIKLTDVAFVKY